MFGRKRRDDNSYTGRDNQREIAAHKETTKRAVRVAKDSNQKLNDILVANGFTLKIFTAIGGHSPGKQTAEGEH